MFDIRRNPDVIWDEVDGVPSFCDTCKVEFFHMNATGRFIWEVCEGASEDGVIDRLAGLYPGEPREGIASEVRRFLGELSDLGYIEARRAQEGG